MTPSWGRRPAKTRRDQFGKRARGFKRAWWFWLLVFAVVTGAAFVDGGTSSAATRIAMKQVSVGFGGYYSKQSWIPVTVTLTNPGAAEFAELVVPMSSPVGTSIVAYGKLRWPVWLPAHKTVQTQVLLPGTIIGDATLECIVSGTVVASKPVAGNALGNVALVAVLAKRAQTAQSFMGSEDGASGKPVLPVTLSVSNFPASINGLGGLTALVATPSSLAGLSASQTNAIQTWVGLGGLLVVTGTSNEATRWNGSLPLTPSAAGTVSGSGLNNFIGESAFSPPKLKVAAGANSLKSGATAWAETGQVPLIAEISEGRGTIVQTSFSLADPALLAWPGNASLWTTVLKMGDAQTESAIPQYLSQQGVFSLTSASDVLAPLRVPSLRFWASLFAGYALLVGPILFWLLRRLKHETAAWVILPAVSILVTLGIYMFGAHQRPNGVLTEATGVLDLVGDGTGQAYGVRGFMSPRVTTLTVHAAQPMLALPLVERNNPVGEAEFATIAKSTSLVFAHVARWGVRYAYLAGAVSHQGELQVDLMNTSGSLFGTIQNSTPYHLQNVALCWDKRVFELGNLRPGQTVSLDQASTQQVHTVNWLSAYSAYNRDITRSIGRSLGTLAGNEQLLRADLSLNTALVVATTTDNTPALGTIHTSEPIASNQDLRMTLVRQFVPVSSIGAVGEASS